MEGWRGREEALGAGGDGRGQAPRRGRGRAGGGTRRAMCTRSVSLAHAAEHNFGAEMSLIYLCVSLDWKAIDG